MRYHDFLLLFVVVASLFSCSKDIVEESFHQSTPETRAIYDSGYVEWDNVERLTYCLGTDVLLNDLVVPWAPGSSSSIGIPSDWVDMNYRSSDPAQRYYSQENGWRLVYSNLLEQSQPNKYFALYNKYSGILRVFFISKDYFSPVNSSAYMGMGISGTTSLLNFCYDYPLAMSERQSNPATFFSAKNQVFSLSSGYVPNQWYGMEIECAYDSNSQDNNYLHMLIGGVAIANITTSGTLYGSITGNVQTTYSSNNSVSLSISINNNSKASVSSGASDAASAISNEIQVGTNQNGQFWSNIWNKVRQKVPSIAENTITEAISSIFSLGSSAVVKALGNLAKSITGANSSVSKVDLGASLNLSSSSVATSYQNIGGVNSIPLPGSVHGNILFSEKLGVWNLSSRPVVYADMYATSYFYAQAQNQSRPVSCKVNFRYTLSPASLVVNPTVLQDYDIANLTQELVYDERMNSSLAHGTKPYGVIGSTLLYESTQNYVEYTEWYNDFIGPYNLPTCYTNRYWHLGLETATDNLYCRVSFDLVERNGNKVISFSKYFKVDAVQRNFYHNVANL